MEQELNYKVNFVNKDGKEETLDVKAGSEELAVEKALKMVDIKPEGILKVEQTQELEPQVEPEDYILKGDDNMKNEKDLLGVVEESMNSIFSILKDASLKEDLGSVAAEPVATEKKAAKTLKVSFGNSKVYPDSEHHQSEDVEPVLVESLKSLNVKASKMLVGMLPESLIDKLLVKALIKASMEKDSDNKEILKAEKAKKVQVLRDILDKSLEDGTRVDKKKVAELEAKAEEALVKTGGLKEEAVTLGIAFAAFGTAFMALFTALIASWDTVLFGTVLTAAIVAALNKKKNVFESEEVVEVEKSAEPTVQVSDNSIVIEIPVAEKEGLRTGLTDKEEAVVNEAIRIVYSKLQTKNLNEAETVEVPVDAEVKLEVEDDKIVIEIPTDSPKEEVSESDAAEIQEALNIVGAMIKEDVIPTLVTLEENTVRVEIPVTSKYIAGINLSNTDRELLETYLYSIYATVSNKKPLNEGEEVEVEKDASAEVKVEDDKIVIEIPTAGSKEDLTDLEQQELKELAIAITDVFATSLIEDDRTAGVMAAGGAGLVGAGAAAGALNNIGAAASGGAGAGVGANIVTGINTIKDAALNSQLGQAISTAVGKFAEFGTSAAAGVGGAISSGLTGATTAIAAMTPAAFVTSFGGTLLAAAAAIRLAKAALKSPLAKAAFAKLGVGKGGRAYTQAKQVADVKKGAKVATALSKEREAAQTFEKAQAVRKIDLKDKKVGGNAWFNLPLTAGRKKVTDKVEELRKAAESNYNKKIKDGVIEKGKRRDLDAVETATAAMERENELAAASRSTARKAIRSDADKEAIQQKIDSDKDYATMRAAQKQARKDKEDARITAKYDKKASFDTLVNASFEQEKEFLYDLCEYRLGISASEAQKLVEEIEYDFLVENVTDVLTSKGYSVNKQGLAKYVADNKIELSESAQSTVLTAILSKGKSLVEGYTSIKEAFLLEEDYFEKDGVQVVSADEKKDKLADQMALLVARDSHDPLYDELLSKTVEAKKLQDELKGKYGGLGRDKAVSLFMLKAKSPIEPVSTVIPLNPDINNPEVPNAEVALDIRKPITADIGEVPEVK
jgi:hypothetical protein